MQTTTLLDIGTLSHSYALCSIVYALILGVLWQENASRYRGLGFWVIASIVQAAGLGLILLRGLAHPILTVVLANSLLAVAILLMRLGFSRFTGAATSLVADAVALPLFVAAMCVFTFVRPSMEIRTILVSAVFLLFAIEGFLVLLVRAREGLRSITLWPAVTLGLHALASLARIVITLSAPRTATENWFASPAAQAAFLLIYQIINLGLVFGMFLMVTRRLRDDERDLDSSRRSVEEALRESDGRQSAIFRASPLGMMLSHFPDGRVRDVNDAFLRLLDRKREDVVGRLTTELRIWARLKDRERLIAELAATGAVRDAEIRFLRGNEERDALLTMEIIEIGGDKHILNLASDITDRKEAERERERIIGELQAALAEVKTLSGLMPICASCKKIRDDAGYWHQVETYFEAHSDVAFTHGLCPDCLEKLYPELADEMGREKGPSAGTEKTDA